MRTFIHEEAYRTKELMAKIEATPLFFCGCGAIGSNMINEVIRTGFQKVSVVDMDRIEDHNRSTQIWGRRDVGQYKAVILKNRMFQEMGVKIEAHSKKLEASNIEKLLSPKELSKTIVVDGFDNSESRKLVTEHCTKHGITCLHVGLFQNYAEVIWNDNYQVPGATKGQDVCEYPLARSIIMLSVVTAVDVLVRYVEKSVKENYTITLKDLKITESKY